MRLLILMLIINLLTSCVIKSGTPILVKNDDVVKVIHNNFSSEISAINLKMFDKKISIEQFNTCNRLPIKIEIHDNIYRDYLIEKYNKTYNNYYNALYAEDESFETDAFESNFEINNDAKIYYIGNISIHQNIQSALFLLTDTDENNTHYLLLYNFCENEIRSIVVLANQSNSFKNSGNESYFHKDNFFIQLSNFSRTESADISNYFPNSF